MLIDTVKSLAFFIIAGFFEIGGGYMVWLWLREGKGFEFAILGAIMLMKDICCLWRNIHCIVCFMGLED